MKSSIEKKTPIPQSMIQKIALIKFHEIALKGKNQPFFKKKLIGSLRSKLSVGLKPELRHDRVIIQYNKESQFDNIKSAVQHTFGVQNFSNSWSLKLTPKSKVGLINFTSAFVDQFTLNNSAATFAVRARRTNKEFPLTSEQINIQLGRLIEKKTGWKVNLKKPDINIFVEITSGLAYIYVKKFSGPGGLPTGTAGKLISLMSGGIDSPVSTWLAMRRGARAVLVHFHSYPQTSSRSIEKVKVIAGKLAEYQGAVRLCLVPIIEIQKEINRRCDPVMTIVITRYLMLKMAEILADKEKAEGIVTGDNLGQVASQTLANMRTVSEGISMPIYRPLFGHDKDEIIELAKKVGTFETSILPHQDCCSLFMPYNPATKSTPERLKNELKLLINLDSMVQSCLGKAEWIKHEAGKN